jgi:hypothetical protein
MRCRTRATDSNPDFGIQRLTMECLGMLANYAAFVRLLIAAI